MKRIVWLFVGLLALFLVACGSAEEESANESETDGLAGRAPPVVTATPTATPEAATADLSDRLDEMTLDEDDVRGGLTYLGNMNFDFDFETLGLEGIGSGKAHMTMFTGPGQQEMAVSMVILLDDAEAVEQALDQMDEVSVEQMQDAFDMAGDLGGLEFRDLRALDVEGLGEAAFGVAMTFDMPQLGAADWQMVFFGRDSVMAMMMTMGMSGGVAPDAVPLAEAMDAKIKDVILQ